VHRDIKPQNILLGGGAPEALSPAPAPSSSSSSSSPAPPPPLPPLVKLADFGLARTFGLPLRAYTHEIITLWYRCPEILLGQEVYSAAVDIWSVGCIFGEMSAGSPLFTGDSEIDQLYKTFRVLGTPSDADWPLLRQLPEFSAAFPQWPKKARAREREGGRARRRAPRRRQLATFPLPPAGCAAPPASRLHPRAAAGHGRAVAVRGRPRPPLCHARL
jgi:serine/threonine protein kinase